MLIAYTLVSLITALTHSYGVQHMDIYGTGMPSSASILEIDTANAKSHGRWVVFEIGREFKVIEKTVLFSTERVAPDAYVLRFDSGEECSAKIKRYRSPDEKLDPRLPDYWMRIDCPDSRTHQTLLPITEAKKTELINAVRKTAQREARGE